MKKIFKNRPFIIAEAGVNHNGKLKLGLALIDAAADAGADAVKFQTFRAEALVTVSAPKARYQQVTTNAKESQFPMLKRLELTPGMHRALLARCRKRRVEFLSTPFDEGSADLLDGLGVRLMKVPSGELTNSGLLAHVARKGKPVLLSTGMCTLAEVAEAVALVKRSGNPPLVLLHCVSNYPADPADANLRAMKTMADRFRLPVGYSDHTPGIEVSVAAAALGAVVIEKHFTLDKTLPGPDHRMSLEPGELKALVSSVRNVGRALGDGIKAPRPCEIPVMKVARRSLVLARALPAGARLTAADVTAKRPATGLPPRDLRKVIGRRLRRAAPADAVLRWGLLR